MSTCSREKDGDVLTAIMHFWPFVNGLCMGSDAELPEGFRAGGTVGRCFKVGEDGVIMTSTRCCESTPDSSCT